MPQVATTANFDSLINGCGDKLVIVDFYADWCGPCKMIAPKLVEIEKESDKVVVFKVNVDDEEELAAKWNISAMPTFIFFKNGKKIDEFKGANEATLKEKVAKHA